MKKFLAIIPARYASTRFPGKPLALLGGKPIVQRVYERVNRVFEHTVVATDDQRIFDCVEEFGGKAVMTSTNHKSGTDRCFEALNKSGVEADVVVNVQGDEPFIAPSQLQAIARCQRLCALFQPFRHPLSAWRGAFRMAQPTHVLQAHRTLCLPRPYA